jgi:hypothetical protein
MNDATSTQIDARIEGTRIKGYAHHGGYFDVPLFSQITEELWVGGTPAENLECLWHWDDDKDEIIEPRFDAILCLYPWEPYLEPEGVVKIEIKMYDDLQQAFGQVDDFADQLAAWIEDGAEAVLVHCQAGLNRSNLVAARYLIKHKNMTPDEAISLLRSKRHKEVLCNSHFEEWIRTHHNG